MVERNKDMQFRHSTKLGSNKYDSQFKGLENKLGDNNCFINVVLQSLWNIASFRQLVLKMDEHKHMREKSSGALDGPNTANQKYDEIVAEFYGMIEEQNYIKSRLVEDYAEFNEEVMPMNEEEILAGAVQIIEEGKFKELGNVIQTEGGTNDYGILPHNPITIDPRNPSPAIIHPPLPLVREATITDPADYCLICALKDLFIKYKYDSRALLPPEQVRKALSNLTNASLKGFLRGQMGSAEETFEEILQYLHRDHVFPDYPKFMEEYREYTKEKCKIESDLDERGCTPMCLAHEVFGYEACSMLECPKPGCQTLGLDPNAQNIRDYVIRITVAEILEWTGKVNKQFDKILKNILIPQKTKYICSQCKKKTASKVLVCLNNPQCLVFYLEWGLMKGESLKNGIRKTLKSISLCISLNEFMEFGGAQNPDLDKYVLRGFIVFYPGHYMSFFYSHLKDNWLRFDDAKITEIGNYDDVIQHCTLSRFKPVLIFYESLHAIKTKFQEVYCPFEQGKQLYLDKLSTNNFGRKDGTCITF